MRRVRSNQMVCPQCGCRTFEALSASTLETGVACLGCGYVWLDRKDFEDRSNKPGRDPDSRDLGGGTLYE